MNELIGMAVTGDGLRLPFRVAGSGPAILLLNGYVCTTQYWPLFIAEFAKNFSLISWDYRGYRDNPSPPDLATLDPPHFAEDALAVLRAAGFAEAIIVGHSMGVQVMFEIYRQAREGCRALVPLCGAPGNTLRTMLLHPEIERHFSRLIIRLAKHAELTGDIIKPLLKSQFTIEVAYRVGANRHLCPKHYLTELFDHVCGMDFRVVLENLACILVHDARDVLPGVRCPVLVIGGDRDGMTPPSRSREMAASIPGAELIIVPKSSHLAMIEQSPVVHEVFRSFLKRNHLWPGE